MTNIQQSSFYSLLTVYKTVFNWYWTDESYEENKKEFMAYLECEVSDIKELDDIDDSDIDALDLMVQDCETYFDCVANDELNTDDAIHEISLSEIVYNCLGDIFY